MKTKIKYVLISFLAIMIPFGAYAGNKVSQKHVYVAENEVIDGNFLAAGDTVIIDGTINGDVIVAGGTVIVNGVVAGDVIVAGGQVRVLGPVQGDVRLVGGEVQVAGVVARNATLFGGNVEIAKDGAIGWSAMVFAGNFISLGSITKNLRGAMGSATINGSIGQDVWVKVGEGQLVLQPQAWIGGDLNYESNQAAQVMSGATINGEVDYQTFQAIKKDGKSLFMLWLVMVLIKLVGLLVLGIVLITLANKWVENDIKQLHKDWWVSLGWGVLFLVVTPITIIILLFTIIGWALAFLLAGLYVAAILYSMILVSTCFGEWLIKKVNKKHWRGVSMYASMAVGVIIFVLLTSIPILGYMVKFFVIASGLGAGLIVLKKHIK